MGGAVRLGVGFAERERGVNEFITSLDVSCCLVCLSLPALESFLRSAGMEWNG